MSGKKKFVVFGGSNDRAVLAFLRALSVCGQRACIIARTASDRILRTQYRRDVTLVRETEELTLPILTRCILHVQEVSGCEKLVILPSSEYFNQFVLHHRRSIEALGCDIPLVESATYELLTNKRSATALFASAGVEVPVEIPALDRAKLPLVAKPIRNVDQQGGSLYPVLLRTPEDVDRFMANHAEADFFFQELVSGQSLYLLIHVSDDPEHIVLWSERNILQQAGGKSMLLAEACRFHEEPIATRLVDVLKRAGFTGLGMIEMIRAGDRLVFIEMNPRIWGPVQFCLDQGQPLLQAFIGKCLHDDPRRYLGKRARGTRQYYSWLGGLVEGLASGQGPAWHAPRWSRSRLATVCLRNDIYLRSDSWRCFLFEIAQSMRKVMHGRPNRG